MTDSQQLLAEYARNGSEAAFRELVTGHLDLVYSVAFRLVAGDAHRAEDVAQIVFADLARLARTLSPEVMPGGWLHRHTCFVAANTMRGERRRLARERQAVEMKALHEHASADPDRLAPVLDEAINELGEDDRTAILLRFFEQRDFRSVGDALGGSEDAARMRVTRALEKLQALLKRRGVTTSATALTVTLTAGAIQSAPAGLAAAIATSTALAGAALGATASTTVKTIAMTVFQKALIAAALLTATGAGIYEAHQTAGLREQVQALQRERDDALQRLAARVVVPAKSAATPHLPAPSLQMTNQVAAFPVESQAHTNLYVRFKDVHPQLTSAQVEAYLKTAGRTASTLLAAYRTSKDPALLKEAMEKFPNDPEVAYEAVFSSAVPPEQRRQWLNTFEQSAPDNAMANYLSALNYFNAGQIDQGVQELTAAAGKPQFQDYTQDRWQNDQDAFQAAGYPLADSSYFATFDLTLPQLSQVRNLGQDLVDLGNAYRQSGDQASAQAAWQMALNLGQRYSSPSPGEAVIDQLTGMAVEKMAFSAMDPGSPYGDSGQTVQDQLNQLAQEKTAYHDSVQQVNALLPGLSDQDWVNYTQRWMTSGELAANQWLTGRSASK